MAILSFAADSTTLVLNGQIINDLVDGDTVTLTPVNPNTAHTRSTNSVNIQGRSDAGVFELLFRVPKYGESDIFMTPRLTASPPEIFEGTLKEDYVKDGQEVVSTWVLSEGSLTTQPTDTRNNTDGNNLMEYTIRFNRTERAV